jgi:hypothetical protein
MYGDNEGMILRSGTSINCLSKTKLWEDSQDLIANIGGFDKLHGEYCSPCRRSLSLLDFIETYYKEIKGEEVNIHGKGCSAFVRMHSVIRDKLAEFIEAIETRNIENCYCDELDHRYYGKIYDNICRMQDLATEEKYSKMANYKGYGKNRELYRIYHKNFFVFYEPGDGTTVIGRDFDKIRDEFQHWHKYFSTAHHSTILETRHVLTAHPGVKINSDCIGEVLSFL